MVSRLEEMMAEGQDVYQHLADQKWPKDEQKEHPTLYRTIMKRCFWAVAMNLPIQIGMERLNEDLGLGYDKESYLDLLVIVKSQFPDLGPADTLCWVSETIATRLD